MPHRASLLRAALVALNADAEPCIQSLPLAGGHGSEVSDPTCSQADRAQAVKAAISVIKRHIDEAYYASLNELPDWDEQLRYLATVEPLNGHARKELGAALELATKFIGPDPTVKPAPVVVWLPCPDCGSETLIADAKTGQTRCVNSACLKAVA